MKSMEEKELRLAATVHYLPQTWIYSHRQTQHKHTNTNKNTQIQTKTHKHTNGGIGAQSRCHSPLSASDTNVEYTATDKHTNTSPASKGTKIASGAPNFCTFLRPHCGAWVVCTLSEPGTQAFCKIFIKAQNTLLWWWGSCAGHFGAVHKDFLQKNHQFCGIICEILHLFETLLLCYVGRVCIIRAGHTGFLPKCHQLWRTKR